MSDLHIYPAGRDLLLALGADRAAAQQIMGATIPASWPQHPEAIQFTLAALDERPEEADWWMYVFIDRGLASLIGSGGFKGPSQEGIVEIGYEIAPGFQGRGYATAAAGLLVRRAALLDASIRFVDAHTLPEENASCSVLRRAGFARVGDPADTHPSTWHWRTPSPTA